MPSFAAVLAELARAGAARSDPFEARNAVDRLALPLLPCAPPLKEALRAYAGANDGRPGARSGFDVSAVRRAIAAASSAGELSRLRRSIARMAHPDRGGDAGAMAECNALIDAALRLSRRRA